MKILFIVPYIPSRIRIRSFEFIRWLGILGHSVTVATQWHDLSELDDLQEVRKICDQVMVGSMPAWKSIVNSAFALPGSDPLQSVYSWNPIFARQLLDLIRINDHQIPFDIIHVEHLRGARFGLYLQKHGRIPIVWDSVDCISHLFKQSSMTNPSQFKKIINQLELPRTKKFEQKLLHAFSRVLVSSSIDRHALMDLDHDDITPADIRVITNGVDLDYFSPADDVRLKDTLVISGKMSYHANTHMVLHLVNDIMPLVWARRPSVRLLVVGKDPPNSIQRLAEDPRITVTGRVDDIRPYLWQAAISVAPLGYGAGVQNKVLEAMACATPVVASPLAVSALNVKNGEQVLVAKSPEEFSSAIFYLLEDSTHAEAIGQAGRKYVEMNHQWHGIIKDLESIYSEIICDERGNPS